ncbi:MAG: Gfo/Idh/MocA family oxidoreductase [Sedimentisphaerales bacterium]|nr:Gfo/Idh/MocA family oxidoreductase [Sedimentisphaerales bacterium]
MNKLTLVNIGGFGHSDAVFRDLAGMQEAELMGLAPAYEGEDISKFLKLQPAVGKKVYGGYKQMLNEVKPDVAIISTRLDLIPLLIMDAANAGCHIIAEKPLALDLATLEKVRRKVERKKINLTAMLTMRSDPQFVAARQVYDGGVIGEAVLVNARKSYKWGTRPDWFADTDKYGGTIGWVGIHAFDYINYITGLGFTKVAAMQSNFAHGERAGCEDNCALAVELANGAHATISVDYCRPEIAATHGDDWIRIVGTKGVLEASGSKKECFVISSVKGSFQQALPDTKDKIFSRFLLNVLEGKSNDEIARLSFMLTKVCLIAREAARKNKILNIKWNGTKND